MNAISSGYSPTHFASGERNLNFLGYVGSYLCPRSSVWVGFLSGFWWLRRPSEAARRWASTPLAEAILHVVRPRSRKKMIRVYAWRVVAVVTNVFSWRDRPLEGLIGKAVAVNRMAQKTERGVTACADGLCPNPASRCLVHAVSFVETLNRCFSHGANDTTRLNLLQ